METGGGVRAAAAVAAPPVETGNRRHGEILNTYNRRPIGRRDRGKSAMSNWKIERIGEGRYHVRGADGWRLAGIILGGRRRWLVELDGRTWPGAFPSARAAAAALAEYHAIRSATADGRAAV